MEDEFDFTPKFMITRFTNINMIDVVRFRECILVGVS